MTLDGSDRGSQPRPPDPGAARQVLVREREVAPGIFEAAEGPVTSYRRSVGPNGVQLEFKLAFGWLSPLFGPAFRRALLAPEGTRSPWWAPPAVIDSRGARALASLTLLGIVVGYLGTLFTQTVAFAGEEFGSSNTALGAAGSAVRLGGIVALAAIVLADRLGRRPVIRGAGVVAAVLAATGSLAPSLAWLAASQLGARGLAGTLAALLAIVAAEEMPAGARAWAVGLLAMAGGLGAGICVIALRLADLGPGGWRLLYVIPLGMIPLIVAACRRLPESRRFTAPHSEAGGLTGHGKRLALLAAAGLLASIFVAPQSQFSNQFLRSEQGFSGARIGLFTVLVGTPGAIGIVAGGRLADVRGRRVVAAISLVVGTGATLAYFFSTGWPIWLWATVGNMVTAASIPALGVYGPELFPTSMRGKANGLISAVGLLGSAAGLVLAGALADSYGRIGPAMATLGAAPLLLAVLVLVAYPETAGTELEDLNPEDRPPTP
ncbi:MAG: MFS transporter [Acidimicrobiales bacterium]